MGEVGEVVEECEGDVVGDMEGQGMSKIEEVGEEGETQGEEGETGGDSEVQDMNT